MNDLRTAAQQALEALTHGCPPDCTDGMTDSGGVHPWGEAVLVPCPTCTAIADLRAALAQQAEPVQEPVAVTVEAIAEVIAKDGEPELCWLIEGGIYSLPEGAVLLFADRPITDADGSGEVYTAPPQRVAQQAEPKPMSPEQRQRWEELAAMPQQAEPAQEPITRLFGTLPVHDTQQAEPAQDRHRACPTHCCPVHGCKYGHDDCPVAAGAVQPVYPRNNGCEWCADEAEPLNLSDRAVQRRLAAQWGYVPAAQAEPVQEPAYKVKVAGRWHDTEPLAPAFSLPDGEHLLYTAPPQRKLVPLTEAEIAALVRAEIDALPSYPSAVEELPYRLARAVERAVWEKNNG